MSLLHISNGCIRSDDRHARNVLPNHNHEEAFCLLQQNPYSIHGGDNPCVFPRARGGIWMIFPTDRRWLLATILMVVACCLPAAAQEQRRGFYTPPASDAIHAVVAEH